MKISIAYPNFIATVGVLPIGGWFVDSGHVGTGVAVMLSTILLSIAGLRISKA